MKQPKKTKKIEKNKDRYCYNCASTKHFGHVSISVIFLVFFDEYKYHSLPYFPTVKDDCIEIVLVNV